MGAEDIKSAIRRNLNHTISEARKELKSAKEAQRLLERVNVDGARWIVSAEPFVEDGPGKPTRTVYDGSLQQAMGEAIEDFAEMNEGLDHLAIYHAQIELSPGNVQRLPQEYLAQFMNSELLI